MITPWLRKTILAVGFLAIGNPACAQQADFNEVGKQMAIMLQNSHFARLPYNAELSQKFFDDYLRDLDFQKLYFTQEDVDLFSSQYGEELHTRLLQGNSIEIANEIYEVFRTRVRERVEQADLMLANEFDFTAEDSVMMSRKDAVWAEDEAEAKEIWARQIKEAVLAETLRREMLTRMATEQEKPDPGADDLSPTEKVALRYKRLLASVEDVDSEDIANLFLSAVARAYDPHTDYLSFREMSRFRDGMKNELVGIGALLQAEEDGATIIKGIVVGGPADKEGQLKLNDRVVAVNSLNTETAEGMTDIMFMSIDKVVDLIRGKEGTSVALKVEPSGGAPGETKMIVIDRDKVELKDEQASGEIIKVKDPEGEEKLIGVLTLPSFYADFEEGLTRSSVDVERILERLITEKIDGLLFDLRNNGGGSLEEVRRMTGFFIPRGPVVQVKDTRGQVEVKNTDAAPLIYSGPMVVLVDKSSASASEILAGALQDYNRAVIVGDASTFGKATVQQPMDIGRMLPLFAVRNKAGFLKVTIQKFYRPSGSSTQMDGVVPDIILPSITDALDVGEAFLENALPHDRIQPAANFRARDAQTLFLPELVERSSERISKSKDFAYVTQDIEKARERMKANVVSLNKAEREKELIESDRLTKKRNLERRERFQKIAAKDKERFTFYKVKLEDLEDGTELNAYDPTQDEGDYMRRAIDDTANLDETPKWPSKLEAKKREAISILGDLIDLTETAKVVGILGSDGAVR